MAEIAHMHGYPFETILPRLQSLNNARKYKKTFVVRMTMKGDRDPRAEWSLSIRSNDPRYLMAEP